MFHINLAGRYFAQHRNESCSISCFAHIVQNVFFKYLGGKDGRAPRAIAGRFLPYFNA